MDRSDPTSEVVLDASAFVDLLIAGRDGRVARHVRGVLTYVVPSVFDAEVISAMRRRWLRGEESLDVRAVVHEALVDPQIERLPTDTLNRRILELSDNLTPFDASYVALAEALGLPLITVDARLSRAPGPTCRIELV